MRQPFHKLFFLLLLPSVTWGSGIFNPGSGSGGGGGGSSTLQVTESGTQITSPTASINFYGNDFDLRAIGTTSYVILRPGTTNYIQNTLTPSVATQKFSVATGTTTTSITTPLINFSGKENVVKYQDGANLMSFPDAFTSYAGYGTAQLRSGDTFNTCYGSGCMTYVNSETFSSCMGTSCMGGAILSGQQNNCQGYACQANRTASSFNTCVGGSCQLNVGNDNNACVGTVCQANLGNSFNNSCVGHQCQQYLTTGFDNTGLGYQAGSGTATANADTGGFFNLHLGYQSGQGVPSATALTKCTAIGYQALCDASNQTQIGGRLGSDNEVMVRFTSMTVEGTLATVGGKNICLQDGTNCVSYQAQINALGVSTGSLQTQVTATGVSTGTLQTQVTATGVSTGTLQTQITATGVSTGTLQTQITATGVSTGTLQTQVTATGVSTGTLVTLTTTQGISGVKTFSSSVTVQNVVQITSNTITPGATFYQNGLIQLGGGVSASLPLKTDANKYLVTSAIDLSGAEATGTMAAARMPALTGDVTTVAGAVATTLATTVPNAHTFSGVITVTGSSLTVAGSSGLRLNYATVTQSSGTPLSTDVNGVVISTSGVNLFSFAAAGQFNFTAPSWAKLMRVRACGSGGGGAGGEGRAAGTIRSGGSGGGGGACSDDIIDVTRVSGTSFGVTVGSASTAGAGGATAAGTAGSAGMPSSIYIVGSSTLSIGYGGGGGICVVSSGTPGGGGGARLAPGANATNAASVLGGEQVAAVQGMGWAGGTGFLAAIGSWAEWGGGAGGGTSQVGASFSGGNSARGGAGGGGGGSCTTLNACGTGGTGGSVGLNLTPAGGAPGTSGAACTGGTPGTIGNANFAGTGGGPGGADTDSNGCNGGAGGLCGGGGGGGGAGTGTGGNGAAGGVGCVYIWWY